MTDRRKQFDEIDTVPHLPKGSMCATCTRANDDCSQLAFDLMPIIQRTQHTVIVRCTEWQKNNR